MAGASMKDIKLRIKSVESTMQITKAMELVASSKLRRARERMEKSRPYFEILYDNLVQIARLNTELTSPYVAESRNRKTCYVVIAGDRGLAGGYNANIFKEVMGAIDGSEACVLPIGKKAVEFFDRRGIESLTHAYAVAEDVSVGDCFAMAQMLTEGFKHGEYDRICVAFTRFVSMLTQTPHILPLLPLAKQEPMEEGPQKARMLITYEPDSGEIFDAIMPNYVAGVIYSALCESVASEMGARRTAMDAASKNAGDMIEDLSLRYNRARQGAITQEITEIVAGAEQ